MTVFNLYKNIENWIRSIFKVPEYASIEITEECTNDYKANIQNITKVAIKIDNRITNEYKILKPVSAISYKDILFLKKAVKSYALKKHSVLAKLFHFFGWWFIFAGALSAFSVCPICGQVGCPVGVGTSGILAGFLALLKQNGKQAIIFIKAKLLTNTSEK